MNSVFITGIHGFVGINLVDNLHKQYSIFGLDIISRSSYGIRKIFNLQELARIPKTHVVVHLAGIAHDTSNTTESKHYFEVNLGLTKKIFDYFLESDSEKFLFFSSVKAVADSLNGNILIEDHTPDPKTPYGQSKLVAEQYILDQKLPPGKKVYILRPCMIHGPGNKGNLNLLYNIVKKGIPYPLGAFHNLRSFTSIENMVYIIREIIDKEIEPGIYNVADDEPVSTSEIVKLISDSLYRNPRIWNVPKGIVKGLAKTGDIMRLPLNNERLKKLTESYIVSNVKLKSALGVNKMPVSAREGLKHTFESFKR